MNLSIAIIGAGGLGVTAAWELASKLSDKYEIKIYDQDKIELSNLNRQILFSLDDLGKNKAELLVKRLKEKFPSAILVAHPFMIDKNNIEQELSTCCAIVDATDSARTSFLLNDYCVHALKTFSYAGVVGGYGQALLVNPAYHSPCLRCVFGNWEEHDYSQIESTCQAAGIIGPMAGYLGLIQAQTLISAFNNEIKNTHLIKVSHKNLKPQHTTVQASSLCSNQCKNKKIAEVNLTEKECPQTFILSKLALEQTKQNTKLLFSFKTKENALKTMASLKHEGNIVNWLGNEKNKFRIISCKIPKTL